ncbi:MAG: hypothetical protein ACREYF_26415 [Gammaproteobacteria bacterium]
MASCARRTSGAPASTSLSSTGRSWDDAQGSSSRQQGNATRARLPLLLKGLVFGGRPGVDAVVTCKKSGRLYRYYLPTRENKEHAGASGLPRLPAAELEATVLEQVRGILRAPGMVADCRDARRGSS